MRPKETFVGNDYNFGYDRSSMVIHLSKFTVHLKEEHSIS